MAGSRWSAAIRSVGGVLAFLLLYGPALAQVADPIREAAFRDRLPEGYAPRGVQAGVLTLYPKLTLGAERTDNVFAADRGAAGDRIAVAEPELTAKADWSRLSLAVFARGRIERHARYRSEDTETGQVGVKGQSGTGPVQIDYGADTGRYVEPRTATGAPPGAVEPIRYTLGQAHAGAALTVNRLRLGGRIETRRLDYRNGRTATGAAVLQDDRDHREVEREVRLDYALGPAASVYVAGAWNRRDYGRGPWLDRSSHGEDLALGVRLEATALVHGEVQVGRLRQAYDAPAFGEVRGPSYRGRVAWFVTPLTNVTFTAAREVRDAAIPGAAGYVSADCRVDLDHELLRNLVLSAGFGRARDDFRPLDRRDARQAWRLGALWRLNRNAAVHLFAEKSRLASSGAARGVPYEVGRVGLSTTLQF